MAPPAHAEDGSPDAVTGPKTPHAAASRTGTHNGHARLSLDDRSCPRLCLPAQPAAPSPGSAVATAAPSPTAPAGFPAGQVQFRSHTVVPSPPLSRPPPGASMPTTARSAVGHPAGDPYSRTRPAAPAQPGSPGSARHLLRLQTDIQASLPSFSTPRHLPDASNTSNTSNASNASNASISQAPGATATPTPTSSYIRPSTLVLQHESSSTSLKPICRTPSLKTTGHHGFGTASAASSAAPSPIISAMGDVTPLPSPLLSGDSPGPWKKLGRSPPVETPFGVAQGAPESAYATASDESLTSALAHHAKRRAYAELMAGKPMQRPEASHSQPDPRPTHTRDRSLSEYVPEAMLFPRRMVAVSATHTKAVGGPDHSESSYETHLRREPHLSEARGLTPVEKPPTPPPSESSLLLSNGTTPSEQDQPNNQKQSEYFEAHGRDDQKRRRWRTIKLLGQGTFSRVLLATSQMPPHGDAAEGSPPSAAAPTTPQLRYDRRRLVAVKICEHGPKGGASEDRVEMSLKRELEIMRCIHHPSLVRLKAWSIEPSRAILVLSYCPGGDLFDVASAHRDLLTPRLLARIFAELVGAVRYLHDNHIVHRDIKLENVLVNLPTSELADTSTDWATYPYSVTTLTDLGLSRRVAIDEKLETRCGSDDYAAPEVIMGQPYDGRAIDAWSLGVLLYALLEGRLPFDPIPGMSDGHRMRSRTSHRIARVEWRWVKFAGDDGEHEGDVLKFRDLGLEGAMELTEGLLKRARSRWTISKVAESTWVRDAMAVPGGLRFRDEDEGEEVSEQSFERY